MIVGCDNMSQIKHNPFKYAEILTAAAESLLP